MFADCADRIEAGEDPFEDEEESLEELQAQANAAREIIDLLKREKVGSLRELLERHNIVHEDDLN